MKGQMFSLDAIIALLVILIVLSTIAIYPQATDIDTIKLENASVKAYDTAVLDLYKQTNVADLGGTNTYCEKYVHNNIILDVAENKFKQQQPTPTDIIVCEGFQ